MFDRINFYYDMDGKYLGDERKDGSFDEKPFTLHAKDCNAKYFTFTTTSIRGRRGDVPGIHITRRLGPIGKDPYNEDGRPPTCMFRMVVTHIEYIDGMVSAEGFEDPNLSWAGILTPPYTHDYKPLKGVKYMTEEQKELVHDTPYELLKRQRIELLMPRKLYK